MRAFLTRIAALFRRRRLDAELNDEVGFHLAMLEDEYRARGLDAHAARLAARREFGGVAQTQEAYRARRGVPWLESAWKDACYAARGLRRNPGFTAAAVLSLALGIGANTAVFSLFYALMVRTLPVARPGELLSLYRTGGWGTGFASYPLYEELAKRTDLFQGVLGKAGPGGMKMNDSEVAWTEFATGNYFRVLGVKPALGRLLDDGDNRGKGNLVAALSYDFWMRHFGGDPHIVGRVVTIGRWPLTIVGVAAPGFRGVNVDRRADLWAPILLVGAGMVDKPSSHWIWMLARRRPELSVKQVQAAIDVLMSQHLKAVYAGTNVASFRRTAMAQRLEARDGGVGLSMLREQFGKPLGVLLAAVALVLLASCANVANLLLARGAARRKETAMRLSLGATRGRLIRQALAESLLLASLGCALGALLAIWGRRYIVDFLPEQAGDPFGAGLDARILAFAVGISLLSALVFGLVPAFRSTAVDPAAGLRSGDGYRAGRPTLRRILVAAQVALSVVLVLLAGLFGRSLAALRSVDLGFQYTNIVALQPRYPNDAARKPFLATLAALPGVASVSTDRPGPYQTGTSSASIRVPGSEKTAVEPAEVALHRVDYRYFETLGAKPLLGRDFQRSDPAGAVAIVNREFVRQFLPGERQPVGRRLSFDASKPDGGPPVFIVGVVRNIPHQGVREKTEPVVYVPGDGDFVLVRAAVPPVALLPAIRKELARLGPQPSDVDPIIIQRQIDDSIFQDRLLANLSGFLGGLALLLAAVGVYGVVAYSTLQRTREIGVRVALGAGRSSVLWLVLRDALALLALGLAVGLPAALAAAKAAGALVFGVKPGDPRLYAATAFALLAAGAVAALLPARRAAATDPMQALRHE